MEKSEIVKLFSYMNSYYGKKFEIPGDKNKLNMKITTWYDFLSDIDYKVAQIATKKLISNKEWPPTPGEIVQEVKKLQTPEEDRLTAGEAWQMVLKVIRKYGVLYGTKEAESELPRKVLKAANCVGGLRNIGMSDENDTYFMNRFYRVYDEISYAIDNQEKLPGSLKEEIAELTEKYPQLREGKQ